MLGTSPRRKGETHITDALDIPGPEHAHPKTIIIPVFPQLGHPRKAPSSPNGTLHGKLASQEESSVNPFPTTPPV